MDGNTEDLQKFVPQVHFEQIPIKNLCSNQDYQRNLSIKHVQRAAANFDLYQINPVKVSRRDGINYVFNGQHTIEIVALVSGSRETPVWCMVYDDLVYTQEADIFANQMKYVKSLLPYEIFILNVHIVPMPLPLIYIFHPYIRCIYNYYIVHINAVIISTASLPRTSPTIILSGRIRRELLIKSLMVMA